MAGDVTGFWSALPEMRQLRSLSIDVWAGTEQTVVELPPLLEAISVGTCNETIAWDQFVGLVRSLAHAAQRGNLSSLQQVTWKCMLRMGFNTNAEVLGQLRGEVRAGLAAVFASRPDLKIILDLSGEPLNLVGCNFDTFCDICSIVPTLGPGIDSVRVLGFQVDFARLAATCPNLSGERALPCLLAARCKADGGRD